MEKKFDFQNIDVKLYLALSAIMAQHEGLLEDAGRRNASDQPDVVRARLAMEEFELSKGPIPDWAVDWNWEHSLVPGAQLCTRNGRRIGNAHVITARAIGPNAANREDPYGERKVFYCLTDAGHRVNYTQAEIEEAFTIGDWISDPERVLRDFDRHGHFKDEPTNG